MKNTVFAIAISFLAIAYSCTGGKQNGTQNWLDEIVTVKNLQLDPYNEGFDTSKALTPGMEIEVRNLISKDEFASLDSRPFYPYAMYNDSLDSYLLFGQLDSTLTTLYMAGLDSVRNIISVIEVYRKEKGEEVRYSILLPENDNFGGRKVIYTVKEVNNCKYPFKIQLYYPLSPDLELGCTFPEDTKEIEYLENLKE